jgi:pyruvate formate lyase activating enzyme
MGFLVKLDTNGSSPEMIKKIISFDLVDYLAMDIKAPFHKYCSVASSDVDLDSIQQSIKLVMNSGLDYEFRTTVLKTQISKEDIVEIGNLIKGAELYVLQKFVPSKALDPSYLKEITYSDEELKELKNILQKSVKKCLVR